jgi:PAS domain S-box-containing protein
VITGDETYLAPYHAALTTVERQLQELVAQPGHDAEVAGRTARIGSLTRELLRLARDVVQAARGRGADAAREVIAAGDGKAVMDGLRGELAALDRMQVRRLAERERQQHLSFARLHWFLTADTLLALAVALVFGVLIHGEMRRRRGIEASLRRSEEDIAAVLESAADAIIAVDRDGRVTRLNAVAERLTGWGGTEAAGRPCGEVFRVLPSSPALPPPDLVAEVLTSGATRALVDNPMQLDRHGTARPVSASAGPILDGQGRVAGAVLTFRDATGECETRRMLEEFNAELERRVQQRTEALQRFAHIVRSASDMLAFRDCDDRFVLVNEAYCRYFGLRAEDIIGRKPDQLFTTGEYEELVQPLGARCLRGESVSAEGWITYPAMGRRYMELRYDPYLDADGAVCGMVVAARDITERFESEQRLRFSERHFRELINSSPSMVYETSATDFWNPLFLSASVVDLTGYTPDEVLGEADFWRCRLHPDDRDGALAALRAGIAAGACSTEYRFLHRDGNWRWLRDSFRVVDADGAERRIIGSWTDITSYMRTAGDLRDSEVRFKTVAQLGSDLIFEASLDSGEVIWFGDVDALLGLRTGLGPRTLAAWSEAIHVEDRERVHGAVQAQRASPHTDLSEEYRIRPSSGSERWWQVRARLLPDEHGALRKWVGSVRDVTQQRTIEKQLAQAQKMEAVGQLTGGVAHDFNNRLTTILGGLELLQRQLADQPGPLRLINMAIRAVEGGASLTRQLLTFSRRQVLESQVIDVAECIHGMVPLFRQTLGEDIDVRFVQHERPWFIRTDAGLFENALLNLALNARDAMPRGGRLIIETRNVLLEANYIQDHVYANPGEHVLISVSDTGAGIPRDVLPRVLEPFFTTKEPGRGTGLGLSMVYGFMRQSGGHIEVYSEEGHGTSVKLYFPRHTGPVPTKTGAAAGDGGEQPTGRRILVVEDDASVRQLAATQLAELGYDVIEAENGPEALRRADELTDLDLLFTDVIMPGGMTGMDLATRLRRRWPNLEVIFTSGYTQRQVQSHGAGHNARDHWLPKPYSFSTLATKIGGIVRAGSGQG